MHSRPRATSRPDWCGCSRCNIALYWTSPLKLMRGELIDTAIADADWGCEDTEEAAHLT
ncbi:hypothetical protein [Bradyrhizobium cajani]|uniref:hypothetical protein n=1 Tax=Bradyrhizobium cajani TaxID=1928661 RepID=UPI00142F0049|nr:hypothetical protein [Bradyrhizobium cajani]MCP3370817.1 hypothetical protein [Bradyrhizobium cajani]